MLRTARLQLRRFEPGDVDDALAYRDDREFARFLPHIPQPFTRADAEAFVRRNIEEPWQQLPTFAVVLDGRVIGTVNLEIDAASRTAMLGYAIARAHWGRGIAVEAARAVLDWAFATHDLVEIWASTDVDHVRSQRVMTKLGMVRDGTAAAGGVRYRLPRVVVRAATADDEPAIAAVTASGIATLRQTYRPTAAAIEHKAARVLARLVAVSAHDVVGTAEYELAAARVHVIGLHVIASHRRRGIARRMIDAMAELAIAAHARALSLYAIRETGNVPIFERLGFAIVDETHAVDCVSERYERLSEVHMERPLPHA